MSGFFSAGVIQNPMSGMFLVLYSRFKFLFEFFYRKSELVTLFSTDRLISIFLFVSILCFVSAQHSSVVSKN